MRLKRSIRVAITKRSPKFRKTECLFKVEAGWIGGEHWIDNLFQFDAQVLHPVHEGVKEHVITTVNLTLKHDMSTCTSTRTPA